MPSHAPVFPSTTRLPRRAVGLFAAAAVGIVVASAGLTSASANGVLPCPIDAPGATWVGGNVCQIVVDTPSDEPVPYTLPAGITKLSVLLVGGGGGGFTGMSDPLYPSTINSWGGAAGHVFGQEVALVEAIIRFTFPGAAAPTSPEAVETGTSHASELARTGGNDLMGLVALGSAAGLIGAGLLVVSRPRRQS